jgi:hypothetical protein
MNVIINPAVKINSLPHFEFDEHLVNGRPVSVTMRPIRLAGGNVTLEKIMIVIGDRLRKRVIQVVRRYRPTWTDHQIRTRIEGTLQMNNTNGEGAHAHAEHVILKDLTNETTMSLFEKASGAGSNPDLLVFDVKWTYLIHGNTLNVGNAKKWFNKFKLDGLKEVEWRDSDERQVL